ncbi:hypothetical protein GCM10009550_04360 [Actinocorallia libanotica]|uniref:Uncharacterized protein n=1 Tax=Actinocorallia libanotica TaxID=46162 RepID=A0ABN1Q5K2_9ACTN
MIDLGAIVSGLLGGFGSQIVELLGVELETRGALRVAREKARLDEIADERRAATARARDAERLRHRVLVERHRQHGRFYPLGVVGRLAEQVRGTAPAILVSPVGGDGEFSGERIPGLVHEALRTVPGFDRYAELMTGAFVRDADGRTRTIAGRVSAREVCSLEFSRVPAIVVYFEVGGDHVNVFALLDAMFPTTRGETAFPLQIARFARDGGRSPHRAAAGDLPTWQHIDLDGVPDAADQTVAAVIAWFLLSCLDLHWRLRGTAQVNLRGSLSGLPAGALAPLSGPEPDRSDVFAYRLERELRELAELGMTPEVTGFGDDRIALIVTTRIGEVSLIVDAAYPASPPLLIVPGPDGPVPVPVDAASWDPRRTLREIVESL